MAGPDPGFAELPVPTPEPFRSRVAANAFDLVSEPSNEDDILAGYSAGSIAYNLSTGKLYVCIDAAAGAAVWKQVALGTGAVTPLAQFYADVNAGAGSEADAYSFTVPANTLTVNGDSIHAVYAGRIPAASLVQITAYFAGSSVYTSDELNLIGDWRLELDIVRVSSTSARCCGSLSYNGGDLPVPAQYTAVTTGLDFTTGEILKLGLFSDDQATDLVAKMGKVWKIAAA